MKKRGAQAIRRDVLVKQHRLSDRQAKALGHVMAHGSLAIQDFEHLCPEVNRRTLHRDLKAVVDRRVFAEKSMSSTDPTKRYVLIKGLLK